MKRCTGMVMLVLGLALVGPAVSAETTTDANIVTGLDISDSIAPDEIALELDGLARAIRDPRVMTAIRAGERGRIGIAVFAWHHRQFPTVVSWMTIGSPQEAELAARAIEARILVNVSVESREYEEWHIGRLTNLSEAIDHANALLLDAPFAGRRDVINIVGNGDDNVGEDAGPARDRFVSRGGTINGLVLADDPAMIEYYRQQVIGGRASFVMSIGSEVAIADAFVRKFVGDIVAESGTQSGAVGLR
jgi:Ca-activated chloride channel homolog